MQRDRHSYESANQIEGKQRRSSTSLGTQRRSVLMFDVVWAEPAYLTIIHGSTAELQRSSMERGIGLRRWQSATFTISLSVLST